MADHAALRGLGGGAKTVARDPYPLLHDFEVQLVYALATRPAMYERVVDGLEDDRVQDPAAQLALAAVRAVRAETGRGPADVVVVLQHLRRQVYSGKVRAEEVQAVDDLFDEAERGRTISDDDLLGQIVPILRRSMHRLVVEKATNAFIKPGGTLDEARELIDKVLRIGEANKASDVGHVFGPQSLAFARRHLSTDQLAIGIMDLDVTLDGGTYCGTVEIFAGQSNGGKCHPAGQGLLLADGMRVVVEDVRPGDRLLGPNGVFRRVLSTSRGHGAIYEIRPNKGAPWRCNEDHVLTLAMSTGQGERRWSKSRLTDISVRDFLALPAKVRAGARMVRAGADFTNQVSAKPLPLDPYFLGVFLGDGSSRSGNVISVTTPDAAIVECVVEQATLFGLTVTAVPGRGCATYQFCGRMGHTHGIAAALTKLALRGCRSEHKFVPDEYKYGARHVRLAVLAGLLDTDGHCHRGVAYDYISKSERLASDVVFLARSVGLGAYLAPCEKFCQTGGGGTYYRVHVSGDTVVVPCRVPRKIATARKQSDALLLKFDVVPVERDAPYYGFTLDGDGRYLLDDFTITHNTMCLGQRTVAAMSAGFDVCFVTLGDLPREWVTARIIANITGHPTNELMNKRAPAAFLDQVARDLVAAGFERFGQLHVAAFEPNRTTVGDIKDWVAETEAKFGRKIPLVAIDDAGLLRAQVVKKGGQEESSYRTNGDVYAEMSYWCSGEAGNAPFWISTVSQTKRGSRANRSKDVADEDSLADSQEKFRRAKYVWTLNPNEDNTEVLWFLVKNTFGRARVRVGPFPTDYARARIAPSDLQIRSSLRQPTLAGTW